MDGESFVSVSFGLSQTSGESRQSPHRAAPTCAALVAAGRTLLATPAVLDGWDGGPKHRMPKVNETLSAQFSYKGPDGLTDAERQSYAECKPLSCKHEACYKRFMYSQPQKQKQECGPLMDEWKACFAEAMKRHGT